MTGIEERALAHENTVRDEAHRRSKLPALLGASVEEADAAG
jgi:hypothetical protein